MSHHLYGMSFEFREKKSFPPTIDGGNLQLFVDTHMNGNNDVCHNLTTKQQNCNLMKEFTKFHAKSFAIEDWKMIVYQVDAPMYIAIINIKEQIFAKTFASITYADIDNALSLNGYRISFSIDDVEGLIQNPSSAQPRPLLLNIHNSSRIGNCFNFQSDIQKSNEVERSHLQPCHYCTEIKNPMKSNIGIRQFLIKERRQQENIKSIACHVLPDNRNSIGCIASLLGLNEALINALLLRKKHNHTKFTMNIFNRNKDSLKKYLASLQSRHITLINDSEDYWLSLHQIFVAKKGIAWLVEHKEQQSVSIAAQVPNATDPSIMVDAINQDLARDHSTFLEIENLFMLLSSVCNRELKSTGEIRSKSAAPGMTVPSLYSNLSIRMHGQIGSVEDLDYHNMMYYYWIILVWINGEIICIVIIFYILVNEIGFAHPKLINSEQLKMLKEDDANKKFTIVDRAGMVADGMQTCYRGYLRSILKLISDLLVSEQCFHQDTSVKAIDVLILLIDAVVKGMNRNHNIESVYLEAVLKIRRLQLAITS